MRKFFYILFCCSIVVASSANADLPRVSGEPAWTTKKSAADSKVRLANFPHADTATKRFKPITPDRVLEVRARNSLATTKVLQIGIHRAADMEAVDGRSPILIWNEISSGGIVARFAVISPGALALRVGLNFTNIPEGAELRFLGAEDGDNVIGRIESTEIQRLRREQPIYWTPVTDGEQQIVEVYLPAAADVNALRFSVDSVSHMIVSPYGSLGGAKLSQVCEIDVQCASQTTAFVNAKNAVARMVFTSGGSSFVCTGTLLNDLVPSSQIPYFYGANHCISTQAEASTLTTFWFDEKPACATGTSAPTQVAGGAALLVNVAAHDALLLRLNNPPPDGAFFNGWDASAITAGSGMSVIHHPAGDVKKVSLGQVKGFTPSPGVGGSFINVGYTSASTEGGSSGSGILTLSNNQYFLRGGLYGGAASCSNTGNVNNSGNDDYFSRFDLVYPSISQYLAPPNPGAEVWPANCVTPTGFTTPAGAAAGWSVVTDSASEGSCSLKSNLLSNAPSGIVRAQVEYTGAFTTGNIVFDRRVSSEQGYDCLRFTIDNVQQNVGGTCTSTGGLGASGEVAWGPVSVPISAGTHTIMWSYEKNSTVVAGQDTAWIDSVVLPLAPKKSGLAAIILYLMD